MPLGELDTDLIESAVELDVHGVDFLIDTLDQLVERVDVGTLLAHLTLDLGLGHSGIIAAIERVSAGMRSTERSAHGHFLNAADDVPRDWKSTHPSISTRSPMPSNARDSPRSASV